MKNGAIIKCREKLQLDPIRGKKISRTINFLSEKYLGLRPHDLEETVPSKEIQMHQHDSSLMLQ